MAKKVGTFVNKDKEEETEEENSATSSDKMLAGAKIYSAMGGAGKSGTTDEATGGLQGAMSGAGAGASFGPHGAIIGGALGGVTGIMGAKQAKKEKLADIAAKKEMAIAGIEASKEDQKQSIMSKLASAFQSSLLRK